LKGLNAEQHHTHWWVPFNELAHLNPFNDDLIRSLSLNPFFMHLHNQPHVRMDVMEDEKACR